MTLPFTENSSALARAALVALTLASTAAHGTVYTCLEGGRIVYRDRACAGKELRAPQRTPGPAAADKAPAAGGSTTEEALAVVVKLHIGDNLALVAYPAAVELPAYRALVQKTDEVIAQSLLREALLRLAPSYRDRWDRRIASVFAAHFTVAEMRAIADSPQGATRYPGSQDKQAEFAGSLQATAAGLLAELGAEAIRVALEKAAATK